MFICATNIHDNAWKCRMMKKGGYTLVELVAVISIVMILASIGLLTLNYFNRIEKQVEFNVASCEVRALLSYGKKYCKKNNTEGAFIINNTENKFKFMKSNSELWFVKDINYSKNITLLAPGTIKVDRDGYITTACTVYIKGDDGKIEEITVGVGNDIITME